MRDYIEGNSHTETWSLNNILISEDGYIEDFIIILNQSEEEQVQALKRLVSKIFLSCGAIGGLTHLDEIEKIKFIEIIRLHNPHDTSTE